jgi:lysophospholipase L1-like esterase
MVADGHRSVAMNPIALYFASGESLYLGAVLLLLVIAVLPFVKRTWSLQLRNVGSWLALAMMVMACPPFPLVVDLIFVAALVLWFIASNRSSGRWLRWRIAATAVLTVLLFILTAIEFSHRRVPVIVGKASDHLVVIGDSISSGINPRVPSWSLVLQQTTGIAVTDLANPGAQSKDGLAMAERLMPEDIMVLIEIGGNDLLEGVSSEEFGKALDTLLYKVVVPGRIVVMFELPLFPPKIAYGRIPRGLAAKYGVWLIPKRFFAEVIGGANATSDGLHVSGEGTRRMAGLVAQALSRVLKPERSTENYRSAS